MAGALNGIRIIDFGQYIAGPLTAMLLGDNGAEVIRVDPPGGPLWKTAANATWNRGKKSIVLDLKQPGDLAVAQRLVAGADVVVENFRPGVMDRLGLGAIAMTAANERLIYCSIPGFASDDPRAGLPAYEGVVAAATDTYRPSRVPGNDPERPVYTTIPIASNFASFLSAASITAALIARERDGLGQRIEMPMFDAMFDAFGRGAPPTAASMPRRTVDRGGGVYECSDGRYVHYVSVNPRFTDWFIDAVGAGSWRDEGLLDPERISANPELNGELRRRMRVLFKTKTSAEWEELGKVAGIPMCICRTSQEWIEHDHARATQTVVELDDHEYGEMWQPGFAVTLSRTPGQIHARHKLDADRAGILASLDNTRAASMPKQPPLAAPLQGIRLIDTCHILAGPTAGRVLADFGADVIKINNPKDPSYGDHLLVNRGKRTMLLDLATDEGRDIFFKLVDSADVVTQNMTYGQADKLGVSYEDLKARKPDVVYASISAYNYNGPWASGRGYEPLGSAATGMEVRFGGEGKQPIIQPILLNDYGTGILGAYAIMLGLFHKLRTGEGQHVQASLAQTGTMHQTNVLNSHESKVWDEPSGQDALGENPLYRLYRASDAWFFLGATDRDMPRLASIEALSGIEGLSGSELASALESAFATQPVAAWIERLGAVQIGAQPLRQIQQLMADPWVKSHGLSTLVERDGEMVVSTGPTPRFSRTPTRPVRLPKPYGADGAAILGELGLADSATDLAARGIVPSSPLNGPSGGDEPNA